MAPSTKKASSPVDRRKATTGKPSLIHTFTVAPDRLRNIISPEEQPLPKKEETLVPQESKDSSSSTSSTVPAPAAVNGETASESGPNTPTAGGTPAPQPAAMGPPTEGPKKKGVKRGSAALDGNGEPKVRGKPGPKKRKLDDEGKESSRPNGLGGHKLGPKANQGAINAGLRALDRSGKPCRKWNKGGFTLKSFTGTVWEVPRWTAPPKPKPAESTGDDSATVSAEASVKEDNKENKENSQVKSDNSNNGADGEAQTPPNVQVSSPAPVAVAVA